MHNLFTHLAALVRRLEHAAVGDVEKIMRPMTRIHKKLVVAREAAYAAESRAYAAAYTMRLHGEALGDRGNALAASAARLAVILGR